MNALKTLTAAVAAALLTTTAAQAQTAPAPKADPFYAQAMFGWDRSRDLQVTGGPLSDELAVEGGYAAGAALGWRPIDGIRVEVEYLYRTGDAEKFKGLEADFGLGGTSGSLEINTGMVNIIGDAKLAPWLQPYAGFGIGWANVKVKDVRSPFFTVTGEDDSFAYQALFGFTVPVTDNVAFFANSRVLFAEADIGLSVTPGPFGATTRIRNWTVLGGIRFSFGG